jgi:hypothetical protein
LTEDELGEFVVLGIGLTAQVVEPEQSAPPKDRYQRRDIEAQRMKVLKIDSKEMRSQPLPSSLYVETWIRSRLIEAGFDLSKPLQWSEDHINGTITYTQEENERR